MKRVLFVNEVAEIAGTETLLALIMANLDRTRYIPLIACPSGHIVTRIKQHDFEHIPFTFRLRRLKTGSFEEGGIRIINPLALLQKVYEGVAIARIVEHHCIDLLHTNSLSAHIAGMVASRLTGVPIIWHIHLQFMTLLFRFLHPDAMIFVSDFVQQTAFPRGVPPKVHRVYNGIDLTAFDPDLSPPSTLSIRDECAIRPEQPLVAMIGYLDMIKGQHEVIQAWSQVKVAQPDAHLLLIGKAISPNGIVYANELNAMVKALGLEKDITFTGYRADIASILRSIDVYVSFTLNDTLSMMVIEAMSMRKAIIGANSGGLPELITSGENGLLVDKGDIKGLATAICTLLSDSQLRQQFGEAARRRALAQFSIKQCVAGIQEVYDELLRVR